MLETVRGLASGILLHLFYIIAPRRVPNCRGESMKSVNGSHNPIYSPIRL